jgi:tRNA (guanine37-N1)-methyltransferase
VFEGRAVPPVLSSGNHANIAKWRLREAVARTWRRRPELLEGEQLDAARQALLEEFIAERGGAGKD